MKEDLKTAVLVLAAGKGTRMKSSLPKVMQPILEKPMISYCLDVMKSVGDVAVIVGYKGEVVEEYITDYYPTVEVLWQREQLGTGHAVSMARDWLRNYDRVLVVNGDMPLLTEDTFSSILDTPPGTGCSFLSMELDDPSGYGRVVKGDTVRIVEDKDCTPIEKEISEVNAGLYLFEVTSLFEALDQIKNDNAQGEYYLVDVIEIMQKQELPVYSVKSDDADSLSGVNDPFDLAFCNGCLRSRYVSFWMSNGLKCIDPFNIWIGPDVTFQGEATLYPGVQLWGKTSIGLGSVIGSFSVLRDAKIGDGVNVNGYAFIDGSSFKKDSQAGPFCYVRQNTVVDEKGFAGKFVELKKSFIGQGSKVPHLSYLGDATLGSKVNIGAGTITCNYDGVNKNPTSIGDECFIGSDTMLVAPVTLGDRSMTAAGSVITKDVPEDALAIGRARQKVIEGWRNKKKTGGK